MELRMYGFTNYQLTGIQKGIQFLHGVVEYSQMVNRIGGDILDIYNDWANNYKTVILLNGGTSNHTKNRYSTEPYIGSMENNLKSLVEMEVKLATFYEPDLNDMLSAIVFILDERVFNREKYPDFIYETNEREYIGSQRSEVEQYSFWKRQFNDTDEEVEKILKLRDFIKNFRLA